ncbi:hypothetical protein TeGR_g10927 [Tetraparma gracilis]|jgi:hypothetical protein|uniref:C2H2-type domain-containing protein n=1 Tax=Tetraparma gracilis TaxID=2962635 RepID=A0ABQ6MZ51_9STRA|nr:hypothetical protein TeGR_g10927 [Tetraparma gracilis]
MPTKNNRFRSKSARNVAKFERKSQTAIHKAVNADNQKRRTDNNRKTKHKERVGAAYNIRNCSVCKITTKSLGDWEAHIQGKKHAERAELQAKKDAEEKRLREEELAKNPPPEEEKGSDEEEEEDDDDDHY